MLKAKKIVRDRKEVGCWSVQLYHEESGRYYWLDVSYVVEYKDVMAEWNQYIFYNTDEDDMERKAFQENCDNFEEADSVAVAALEAEGELYQDDKGEWWIGVEEWKGRDWEIK